MVEILVSLCVLSIGLVGLARTQTLAVYETQQAYKQTVAAQLAQNQYEEMAG